LPTNPPKDSAGFSPAKTARPLRRKARLLLNQNSMMDKSNSTAVIPDSAAAFFIVPLD
jgi:hypothetical protein